MQGMAGIRSILGHHNTANSVISNSKGPPFTVRYIRGLKYACQGLSNLTQMEAHTFLHSCEKFWGFGFRWGFPIDFGCIFKLL